MKYYDDALCSFYDSTVHRNIPERAVQISDADHAKAIAALNSGMKVAVIGGEVATIAAEYSITDEKVRLLEAVRISSGREEHAPVQVGPYTMRGGNGSAIDLKGQLDLAMAIAQRMPELNITTVRFYDVAGEEIEVPIESDTEVDAWDIVIAVALQVSNTRFKQVGLERAIARANSRADLDTIKRGE